MIETIQFDNLDAILSFKGFITRMRSTTIRGDVFSQLHYYKGTSLNQMLIMGKSIPLYKCCSIWFAYQIKTNGMHNES